MPPPNHRKDIKGLGRVGKPTGLSQAEPQEGLGPSGFDPSRRPWPLCGYAPGNYHCKCFKCERQFEGDKRALECLECAADSANALIEIHRGKVRQLQEWRDNRRVALDELIRAASVFWGVGSEQHNLVRDIADAMFKVAPSDSDGSPEGGDAAGGSVRSTTARAGTASPETPNE